MNRYRIVLKELWLSLPNVKASTSKGGAHEIYYFGEEVNDEE